MNVLIVDDDKLARKGLIAVIDWEQYGLCVVGDVQNGKKALEFLENHPVDLVFTDIDMPEMNGLELMKICKESYPETDFVIFSVYEDFSFARQALRLGALDYISKIEFDPEECDAIMKKIVETYQNKRREKAERNLRRRFGCGTCLHGRRAERYSADIPPEFPVPYRKQGSEAFRAPG